MIGERFGEGLNKMHSEEKREEEKKEGEEDLLYEYNESQNEDERLKIKLKEYANLPSWRELTPGERKWWDEQLGEIKDREEYDKRIAELAAKHAPVSENERIKEKMIPPEVEETPPKFTKEERNRMGKRKKSKNAQWSGERPSQVPKYKNKVGPTIRREAA